MNIKQDENKTIKE